MLRKYILAPDEAEPSARAAIVDAQQNYMPD